MSRRLAAGAAATLILAAGCGTPSEIDPDAQVEITGTLVDQGGAVVPDARAVLVKEIGVDEFLSGAMTVMTTWGFACVVDAPVDPCGEYTYFATTDGDGGFTFTVRGADVQSGFGTVSTMTATAAAPPRDGERTGAAVSLNFQVQEEVMDLPPFRLWQPQVDVSTQDGNLVVAWPTMPDGFPADARYEAIVSDGQGRPLWTITTSGESVDLRVLEDLAGGVAVQATAGTQVDERDTTIVHRSAQLPVTGPGAPPSRGAACATTAAGRAPVQAAPCPLTDGDLTTPASLDMPSDCPSDGSACDYPDRSIVLDLGSSRPLTLVVLRGEQDDLAIDVSDDGQTWQQVAEVEMTATSAAATLPPDTSGRYVRVRAQSGDVGDFSEIALW